MDDGAFCPNDATEKRHVGDSAPSEAVVRTVAEARDCEPTDLPPLNGTIDPDALDDLFDDTMSGGRREGGHAVFDYCDCTVALLGPDDVVVEVTPDADD
ncbi:HalOD1 output domain-containing protein [Halorussus caseinilyticus]|uniref:HalOD1 output domain-containing protein n=1 Tax=Halorussus caseinilyticus TaxID=3034025 RepID=UPI0023E7C238|nr:HalOD1 output domain-containing protein [Halorussus sp. DT72]